jgi:hypothetical protein
VIDLSRKYRRDGNQEVDDAKAIRVGHFQAKAGSVYTIPGDGDTAELGFEQYAIRLTFFGIADRNSGRPKVSSKSSRLAEPRTTQRVSSRRTISSSAARC